MVLPPAAPLLLTELAIFGYGSLLWRPGFAFSQVSQATVAGWSRRLYQASPDHRGTEAQPGRVPTLVPDEGGHVTGRLYLPRYPEQVLGPLDHRERGGYDRLEFDAVLPDGRSVRALCYAGRPDNRWWLGPAPAEAIAKQIQNARGESGRNVDYLRLLQSTLHRMQVIDEHVEDIADWLK